MTPSALPLATVRARLLVVGAAACFATTGTAQALGPDGSSGIGVAAVRSVIGALALVILSLLTGRGGTPASPVGIVPWLAASAGMAAFAVGFFSGLRLTGVAVGTVLALASAPVIAGAAEWLLWRRAPSRRWMGATAVAVVGMILLVGGSGRETVRVSGVALTLLAGAGYAAFALATKRIVAAGHEPLPAMARVFVGCALLLSPALVVSDLGWLGEPRGWALAVWLGIVSVAIAYWAYASGLRTIQPSEATMLTLSEPALAVVLGASVLGERPTAAAWAGVALVLAALVRASTPERAAVRH